MDIMIIDDEPLARKRLHQLVLELGHNVIAEAGNSDDALNMLKTHAPSILLLDIEMPGENGLALAKRITTMAEPPAIIFTTAYDQYALEAFGALAAGYLLKPIQIAKVSKAIDNAKQVTKLQRQTLSNAPPTSQREHIVAKGHRGIELLPISDVRYFMADQKYVMVMSTQGQILIDETLKDLEEEFSDAFIRIHRNALVSVQHIHGIERSSDNQNYIRFIDIDDKPLVSRRYTAKVKALLQSL